jgi:hypothetical protein
MTEILGSSVARLFGMMLRTVSEWLEQLSALQDAYV